MGILVPTLVLLGLLTGFLRELVLAYVFGTNQDVEVFRVAYAIPSITSEAVAVSLISGLIPILLRHKKIEGFRLAYWSIIALAAFIATVGILTMPFQASVLAPGFPAESRHTLIFTGRICWMMTFLLLLSYPLRASMSLEGRIWPSAVGTFLRNTAFVGLFLALSSAFAPSALTASWAAALSGAIVLGAFVWLFGRNGRRRLAHALWKPPKVTMVLPVSAALLTIFAAQLLSSGGRVIDRMVSSTLQGGALASIEYSYSVIMAMAAFIGTSANLVIAPAMGRAIRDEGRIPARFWKSMFVISTGAMIVGITCAAFATPFIRLIYARGAFGQEATSMTAIVFEFQLLALGFVVANLLLVQALILLGGQRLFVGIAAAKVCFKIGSLWVALRLFGDVKAIAVSFGMAEAGGLIILLAALTYRQHRVRRDLATLQDL
ncbi:lipid II flippase MurJ [Segeticoccus rhizosphaerae]|uniref:lipid II flippase MurJ n=1 Tax=Segeticoccus rhizosphaerae TaxID=1104777 RepID=UPI00138FCE78|nr:lipid II flippase MurJ [Ornithinicoccus soli]